MFTVLGEWGFLDNLNDTSGNARHATANFTPTYIDGPTLGTRAIRFSGSGQTVTYGRTGLEPTTGGIVTMGWVKLFSDVFGYTDILHKTRAFDSTRHAIDVHDNSIFWMSRWRDQLQFSDSGGPFGTTWHHFCNVDSDDRYAWFIDGVKIANASRAGASAHTWENFPWVSGANTDMTSTGSDPDVAFTGLRILQGTLSDAEVISLMNTPVVPITGRSGKPKVRNGSGWVSHPAKYWDGSAWVVAPMLGYDGTGFIESK